MNNFFHGIISQLWNSGSLTLYLVEKDIHIIKFLFESKGASYEQIKNYACKTNSQTYTYKRLAKLKKMGLVHCDIQQGTSKKYLYYLTRKGALKLDLTKDELRNTVLKSDKIAHDNLLVEIRQQLQNLKYFRFYFTENMIKSGLYCGELEEIRDKLYKVKPDGLVSLSNGINHSFCAVELEVSQKTMKRYQDLFYQYTLLSGVDLIFYIVKNNSILKKVKEIQQKFSPELNSKIHYAKVDDVLDAREEIYFETGNGKKVGFSFEVLGTAMPSIRA